MGIKRSPVIFASSALLAAQPAAAAPVGMPAYGQLGESVDAAVAKGVPSLVVVLFDRDRILWSHTAGYADAKAKISPTLDTQYRVGSMAKAVTSTVLAIAAQKRLFSFDKTISVRTASGTRNVSVRQAVNMQAGFAQAVCYQGITGKSAKMCATGFDQQFAIAISDGAGRYSYSNMGPQVAADALQTKLRRPFPTIARELLFSPIGMRQTSYHHAQRTANRAVSYDTDGKPYGHDFEILPAAGAGLEASSRDLVRFGQLHLGGSPLLDSQSRAMLHSAPNDGFYGYGWGRIGAGKPTEVLISDGQVNGGQAMLILSPRRGVGALVVANAARDEVSELAVAAIDVLAPGTANAFAADVATMQSAHEAKAAGFLPPPDFNARGFVRVGDNRLPLAGHSTNNHLSLATAQKSKDQSESSTDEGYRGWPIPCPDQVPACSLPGATAKLWLTKDHGGLSGQLQVTSFNGQVPYAVRLQLH